MTRMTTDFRGLCAELADALDSSHQRLTGDPSFTHPLAARARAALAGEAVGPSDEDLLELMSQAMRDDLASVSRLSGIQVGLAAGVFRTTLNVRVLEYARAVLARYGSAPTTIEPDTADVLRLAAIIRKVDGNHDKGAAALAEAILSHPDYRSTPRPVPVAERLPGAEDCDQYGCCWYWLPINAAWHYRDPSQAEGVNCSHWLPAHALPIPTQENNATTDHAV